MSKFIRLYVLRVVFFACEPDETFMEDVDAPGVHWGDQNVYSNVKLEAIYQHRIRNVAWHDACFVDGHLWDFIYNEDTLALWRVGGLDDPLVFVSFDYWVISLFVLILAFLFELVEVAVEVSKFVGKIISIWDDIKRFFTKLFLHFDNVRT